VEEAAVCPSLFLSLQEGVLLESGDEQLVFHGTHGSFRTGPCPPAIRSTLQWLHPTGEEEDLLFAEVRKTGGPEAASCLRGILQELTRHRLLLRSAFLDGQPLATLVPVSPDGEFPSRTLALDQRYILSRFAYTRRERDTMVLESPLSKSRIILRDWRSQAILHALTQARRSDELSRLVPMLPAEAISQVMALLLNAQMIGRSDEAAIAEEDRVTELQSWEFHDLLFHAHSRGGRHDRPAGGTYRFIGQLEPPPVVRPAPPGEVIPLYRPDLRLLEQEDPPLARVQEARRSIRQYAKTPISDRQVGEFLYRVGRVADYWKHEVSTPQGALAMEFAARPYPSGGALYELEVYVVVNACENLSPGLYYYDPQQHGLRRTASETAEIGQLLADASRATRIRPEDLQVLIIISARFQRIAWKYASIAYSLVLKNVGVLYQTMYLAATAMGLAPCAVGSGNADLFARAAGTDYYTETSVGEFLLGSKE
jgi:oxazoline/thiazoline dehydrogenase